MTSVEHDILGLHRPRRDCREIWAMIGRICSPVQSLIFEPFVGYPSHECIARVLWKSHESAVGVEHSGRGIRLKLRPKCPGNATEIRRSSFSTAMDYGGNRAVVLPSEALRIVTRGLINSRGRT
jgi:hypothetical protein